MSSRFFEPYLVLEELFKAEQLAFRKNDTQKLAALAPQIKQCCQRVAGLEDSFAELSPAQIQTAKQYIHRLQELVTRSRNAWEQYQLALEKERSLLQSSKRLVHQARLEQSARSPRISHSA